MKFSLRSLLPGVDHGWKSMYTVCALQTCQSTLLMRSIQSRVGINVGQLWYCSVDCFAVAARKRFPRSPEQASWKCPITRACPLAS